MNKISGPLLDRIDIHIEVRAVKKEELLSKKKGEPSSEIKKRVNKAREVQLKRFKGLPIYCNAQMSPKHIRHFSPPNKDA